MDKEISVEAHFKGDWRSSLRLPCEEGTYLEAKDFRLSEGQGFAVDFDEPFACL